MFRHDNNTKKFEVIAWLAFPKNISRATRRLHSFLIIIIIFFFALFFLFFLFDRRGYTIVEKYDSPVISNKATYCDIFYV